MPDKDLNKIRTVIRRFAADRDWDQFHSPKNLAMALADEIADIFIYLIRLADKLDIDPIEADFAKIKKNAEKYPAERVRGSMTKYNEYD